MKYSPRYGYFLGGIIIGIIISGVGFCNVLVDTIYRFNNHIITFNVFSISYSPESDMSIASSECGIHICVKGNLSESIDLGKVYSFYIRNGYVWKVEEYHVS